MDYLKVLRENPDLAEEFDSLFDFFLLDELSPREGGGWSSNLHTARHGFCKRWLRRRIPPVGRWLHRLLQQRR